MSGTEHRTWIWLGAAAALAVGVPVALHQIVAAKLHGEVEPRLSAALGVDVAIDDAEVGLLGTFRLSGVRAGELFRAESVEAAVGLDSLLRGTVAADEISVSRPWIRARVNADGTIDATELLRRARDARTGAAATSGSGRRLRRIVVTGGALVVELAGHGELSAEGVELHPQEGGVRVVTGPSRIRLVRGDVTVDARFPRAACDLALPELAIPRAALDGGTLTMAGRGRPPLELDRVVVARGVGGPEDGPPGSVRLEARLAGKPERLSLRAASTDEAIHVDLEVDEMPLAPLAVAIPGWIDLSSARGGGRAVIAVRRADKEVRARGAIALAGARVDHPLLDDEPVPVSGSVDGALTWNPSSRDGNMAFTAKTGALRADAEVELSLAPARVALRLGLAPTECAGALAAIPIEVRRGLDGLELSGRIGGRIELAVDASAPEAARLDVELDVGCRVDRDAAAADPAALRRAYSHTFPDGTLRLMAPSDPDFVPLDELPDHVFGAFVAGEDGRFFAHHGFDREQVRRSLAIDVAAGRVARGGSTISQQLVKNLYLGRERTLSRKLVEALMTWRLEQRVAKRRILELYLNLIELGEGVYGLGPAARRWFDADARDLSVEQAAFLAALTPAPLSTERRLAGARALDAEARRRVELLLRAMRRSRVIDGQTHARALARLPGLELRTTVTARR